jgi:hypothetical protein
MHLIWENIIKNLFLLWFGDFKGLDAGTGNYQLDPDVIRDIGAEGAAAGPSIPYVFGAAPPNIASDKVSWTAHSRLLWTLHLAPALLRERLPPAYFTHFLLLVKLLNICLKFDMDCSNIEVLRDGFASWVETFEEYVVFHALLAATFNMHRNYPHPPSYRGCYLCSWPGLGNVGLPHGAILRQASARGQGTPVCLGQHR